MCSGTFIRPKQKAHTHTHARASPEAIIRVTGSRADALSGPTPPTLPQHTPAGIREPTPARPTTARASIMSWRAASSWIPTRRPCTWWRARTCASSSARTIAPSKPSGTATPPVRARGGGGGGERVVRAKDVAKTPVVIAARGLARSEPQPRSSGQRSPRSVRGGCQSFKASSKHLRSS